ncbi:MAG: RNA polymerase sigma factor, partial [Pseudomonadota bacterium]
RNPDLAADAVQDALLSAWAKRDQFQQSSKLDTWIHRIAVNAALQLLRRQKPGVFEPYESEVASADPGPAESLDAAELDDSLSAALQGLSDIERLCFVLKHLEQWRIREIADELECSEGTVKQAVFRGVRKLRGRMDDLRRDSA